MNGLRFYLRVTLAYLVASLCLPVIAWARPTPLAVQADELQSLTFSNLVIRVSGASWIGVGGEELRVRLLEHLRLRGYPALGAESLVFNQDKSADARFKLGGTLTRAECRPAQRQVDKRLCRVSVTWELFSTREDRVVYSTTAWSVADGLHLMSEDGKVKAATKLILLALDSLLSRPQFVQMLKKTPTSAPVSASYRPATFRQCAAVARPMPASASAVLGATVLVETNAGFGSGTLISPDGLVLTAAHVVTENGVKVRLMSGQTLPAAIVRVHKAEDVALLYVSVPSDAECIPLRTDAISVGDEVYAIGSPASKDLAFTLTRGIVSGTREIEGVRYLQTDASVNPGNSGGPLVDAQGRAVGVVSWKVAGHAMEGIAFGVPVDAAQEALAVSPGLETDPSLRSKAETTSVSAAIVKETADPVPSIDPEGDRMRAEAALKRAEKVRRKKLSNLRWNATPGYVKLLKYGGIALTSVSTLGVLISWFQFDSGDVTRADFEKLRLVNDMSWVGLGLGAASTVTGIILTPSVSLPEDKPNSRAHVDVAFGLASGHLTVRY